VEEKEEREKIMGKTEGKRVRYVNTNGHKDQKEYARINVGISGQGKSIFFFWGGEDTFFRPLFGPMS
jgi:hypothetical protein